MIRVKAKADCKIIIVPSIYCLSPDNPTNRTPKATLLVLYACVFSLGFWPSILYLHFEEMKKMSKNLRDGQQEGHFKGTVALTDAIISCKLVCRAG